MKDIRRATNPTQVPNQTISSGTWNFSDNNALAASNDVSTWSSGIDAVGLGSDFDGIDQAPVGLDDVSKFPNLTRALLEKGYSAEAIAKIYGGNLLRLMRAVEAAAGRR